VTDRPVAWRVFGRSSAGVVGSNPNIPHEAWMPGCVYSALSCKDSSWQCIGSRNRESGKGPRSRQRKNAHTCTHIRARTHTIYILRFASNEGVLWIEFRKMGTKYMVCYELRRLKIMFRFVKHTNILM
jgi:hypothetical protein